MNLYSFIHNWKQMKGNGKDIIVPFRMGFPYDYDDSNFPNTL